MSHEIYARTRIQLTKEAFNATALANIQAGYPMYAELLVNGQAGDLTLRNEHIMQGSLSIDRYTVSGERIEIGSTVAAELAFNLNNADGQYDGYVFEGAQVTARLLIHKDASSAYLLPMGVFTVDTPPRKLQTINIRALDGMMRFDKPYTSTLVYPATLNNILTNACTACNVLLETVPASILTGLMGYTVTARPENKEITYRQIVQWICELVGACAFMDWDGKLRLTWYDIGAAPQFTTESTRQYALITKSERFNSDMHENGVTITGVRIVGNDKDATEHVYGSAAYALNIEGNLLAQDNLTTLVNSLGARLTGYTYRPYTCTMKSAPHLWPMDGVTYVDKDDVEYSSIVTNHTFRLNRNSEVAARAQTVQTGSYATASPLTGRQQAILNRLASQVQSSLTSLQQMQLELNRSIANGMGLYTTTVEESGIARTYYHDAPNLTESGYIFTYNSGGFAWTKSGWNDGEPVWQYGFTADGNSILNTLSVFNITADQLAANSITADKIVVGAGDKNYVTQWDLLNWVDSTAPTPSQMVTLTDSPVGGITKARRTYAQTTNVHTIYSPSAEAFAVGQNEVLSYEGFYKASAEGLRFRVSFVEQTSAKVVTTAYITAPKTSWTRFSVKIKIPDTWTVLTARAVIEVQKRTTSPLSGTIDFTGITVKKTQSAAIITDGRIESVNKNTYLDLGTGELAVEGGNTKAVIANAGQKWDGDGFYLQGLFWTAIDTDVSKWNDPNNSTLFTDAIAQIYAYDTSWGSLQFKGLSIEHGDGEVTLFGGDGITLYAGQNKNIRIDNSINLPNNKVIRGKREMFNTYETLIGKSTADNTVVGSSAQGGHTNIYTHSGGRINFYVGTTRAGYIDSAGWHNG